MYKELVVAAQIDNLHMVQEFFDEMLEEAGASMKDIFQIDVAVEEIFVNIANYAYGDLEGTVALHAETIDDGATPKRIVMTFIDQGTPFDPLKKEDTDVTLSAEERQIGGLGIFMVKKSMDDVTYTFENDSNILTLVKNI